MNRPNNETENVIDVQDLINDCIIKNLGEIPVPIKYDKSIRTPIVTAIGSAEIVLRTINAMIKKAEELRLENKELKEKLSQYEAPEEKANESESTNE